MTNFLLQQKKKLNELEHLSNGLSSIQLRVVGERQKNLGNFVPELPCSLRWIPLEEKR
jgi:hypothetical protein